MAGSACVPPVQEQHTSDHHYIVKKCGGCVPKALYYKNKVAKSLKCSIFTKSIFTAKYDSIIFYTSVHL